ncbi:MAG TPA: ABA4-like family protein [Allosphingosinicella sp.]|jgi:hypothetical protein
MPDAATAVPIGNLIAGATWIALIASLFVPALRRTVWPAARWAVPALFALLYIPFALIGLGEAEGGGFGSAAEIRALFASDHSLGAGWVHYLAFDLFVGSWIAELGLRHRVPALLLVPCLILTFLFGPAGLLLFLLLRLAFRRRGAAPETAS